MTQPSADWSRRLPRRWLPWARHLPCLLCGATCLTGQPQLCQPCLHELPWHTSPRCPQCALPSTHGEYCGQCLRHSPAFDHTFALLRYAYPLDRLLQQFKYQQRLDCGQVLIESVLQQWPHPPANADVVLAMPVHLNRLKQRGFNHAALLATALARHWQLPYAPENVKRIKDTAPQAGLDMRTRTRSLRGAFISQPWQEQHVMIVDDVMTTGASMHALAHVIKNAGASSVSAVVVARTLK